MRRTKLLWFALGAATSALVTVGLKLSEGLVYDDTTTPYLILIEPPQATVGDIPQGNERNVAFETGGALRKCGARAFETTALYDDHPPTAEMPIVPENYQAIECVIASIRDNDRPFTVEMRWSSDVADEMRSKN